MCLKYIMTSTIPVQWVRAIDTLESLSLGNSVMLHMHWMSCKSMGEGGGALVWGEDSGWSPLNLELLQV